MEQCGFECVWERIRDFEGWLTEEQARRLWICAQRAPGDRLAEIGSHQGKSSAVLANARVGATLFAIDPWDDRRWGGGKESFERFRDNLGRANCPSNVEVYRGLSSEAHRTIGTREFDLVYIDGAHDFVTAQDDIQSWGSRISVGGFIAIHDCYSSIGVTKAVFAALFTRRNWSYRGCTRSLVVFQRNSDSLSDWVVGRLRMGGRLWWFARNLAIKFASRKGWTAVGPFLRHYDRYDPF